MSLLIHENIKEKLDGFIVNKKIPNLTINNINVNKHIELKYFD